MITPEINKFITKLNQYRVVKCNINLYSDLIKKEHPCEHLQITSKENAASLCLKLHYRFYPCFIENFNEEDANFFDRNDNYFLHFAALLMDADLCKKLLDKGANIRNRNKYKNTALMELLLYLQKTGMEIVNYFVKCKSLFCVRMKMY